MDQASVLSPVRVLSLSKPVLGDSLSCSAFGVLPVCLEAVSNTLFSPCKRRTLNSHLLSTESFSLDDAFLPWSSRGRVAISMTLVINLHTALVTNHHVTVIKVMPTKKAEPALKYVPGQDRQKTEDRRHFLHNLILLEVFAPWLPLSFPNLRGTESFRKHGTPNQHSHRR